MKFVSGVVCFFVFFPVPGFMETGGTWSQVFQANVLRAQQRRTAGAVAVPVQNRSPLFYHDWNDPGQLFSESAFFYGSDTKTRKTKPRPIVPAARRMVEQGILAQHDWENPLILSAIMRTAREKFVPANRKRMAYDDLAIPLGRSRYQQAPSVLAFMFEKLDPGPDEKILEIGTGSGYGTAVLSLLAGDVYTIEIDEAHEKKASRLFDRLGYTNIRTKCADGFHGWVEHAPFDKIVFTCSPETVPQPLIDQLREGGTMIVPLGEPYRQVLYLCQKKDGKLQNEFLLPRPFEIMAGEAETLRVAKPNPDRPDIANGHFERFHENGEPYGWSTAGGAAVRDVPDAPEGRHVLELETEPLSPYDRFPHDGSFRDDFDFPDERSRLSREIVPTVSRQPRSARAEQSFALDGKHVSRLRLEAYLRCDRIPAPPLRENRTTGSILITFFDEDDRPLQRLDFAPVSGSFDWKRFQCEFSVPRKTTKATVTLAFSQKSGKVEIDALTIRKAGK